MMLQIEINISERAREPAIRTYRTITAWMRSFRSSSTVFMRSADSAFCSDLIGALSCTRIFLDLKSESMQRETSSDRVRESTRLTKVQVVRVAVLSQDLLLDKQCQIGPQSRILQLRALLEIVERQAVRAAVELEQDRSLVVGDHKSVLLFGVVGPKLHARKLPEPGELAPTVLILVIAPESLVCRQEFCRHGELGRWRLQWPSRSAEDEGVEIDCRGKDIRPMRPPLQR